MLTVETGAIIAGAESYVTAAECDTYHTNRGNATWTGTDTAKEAALRKAAAYLDSHYRRRWKGNRVYPLHQFMEWPRYGVDIGNMAPMIGGVYLNGAILNQFLPSDEIPQRVKDAQCELALRALSADLNTDIATGVVSKKVDVLETTYNPYSTRQTIYPFVDSLLSDYLKSANSCEAVRG